MKDIRLELYYSDGSIRKILFHEPTFQWHRHIHKKGQRPTGLKLFVDNICEHKDLIVNNILNYRKDIIMNMYPKESYQEEVNNYLLDLEQVIKDKCYDEEDLRRLFK